MTEARKREANPGVVGEALEEVVAHSHIPAEREQVEQVEQEQQEQQVEQVEQEEVEAHNHIQVQEEEVHPYPDTSRQHKPHQSLPDPMASLRLYRQKRTL